MLMPTSNDKASWIFAILALCAFVMAAFSDDR